jgi:predicted phosphodiesterase
MSNKKQEYRPRLNKFENELIINHRKPKMQKWLVLPDIHTPFHNKILFGKIVKYIRENKQNIYGICLSGDFLDLFTLGSYNENSLKNLTGITLESEYAIGNEVLDGIDNALGKYKLSCKKYFLYGNHEDRYFREIAKGDKAKYGNALMSPTDALKLHNRGYEVKENWKDDYFTLGEHLDIIHGVYCNVHTAKKHLDVTGRSIMFGHTHRVQSFRQGKRASYNIGWLGNVNHKVFNYMPRFQKDIWANGFAEVYIDNKGLYYVNQISVYNDSFFINGKMY